MFVGSASVILILTAIAKFVSSFGTVPILHEQDPILGVTYRVVFLVAGSVEIVIGSFCLFAKGLHFKIYLISWLATMFGIYRLGLILLHYQKPCSCLGNLTDYLHIDSAASGLIMNVIFLYLLIGSYVALFWLWRQRNETLSASSPTNELA